LAHLSCVEDVEEKAREVLPRGAIGYYWGGTADERTVARNRKAFKRLPF
jgi:isopentenyl diphosphate isomerase/L-lactate dehydrogenase-like FMN-dependent dehydrogenase